MTIARVSGQASGNNNTSATITEAFNGNVTSGNMIVVFAGQQVSGSSNYVAGDCTKSAGTATIDTPQLDAQVLASMGGFNGLAAIWSALVTGSGTLTIQVDNANGTIFGHSIHINEYSGSFDATRTEDSNTNSDPTNDVTPHVTGAATAAGAALFAAMTNCFEEAGTTLSANSGFTEIDFQNAAGAITSEAADKIVASGETDEGDWTAGDSLGYAAAIVVYKEAAGGGGISIPVVQHHRMRNF